MDELRALVVDDHEDSLELLCLLLEKLGVIVQGIASGDDAVRVASQFRPDVVFLDIGLPDVSGFEVARRLRALPETQHAYITAITGRGRASDDHDTIAAGMDHHILKPASREMLEKVLLAARASKDARAHRES